MGLIRIKHRITALIIAVIMLVISNVTYAYAEDDIVIFNDTYESMGSFITFDSESKTLSVDESITLKTILYDGSSGVGVVNYTSSDEKVLTVDENGTAYGVGPGECIVTAQLKGSLVKATCKVTVYSKSELSLKSTNNTLFVGNHVMITAEADVVQEISWKSSNESIATIDSDGIVTGVSAGKVDIKATCDDGATATLTLTVKKAPSSNITLTSKSVEIRSGQSYYMKAGNYSGTVNWSSNDANTLQVSKGIITALKKGVGIITAKSSDGKLVATAKVKINSEAPIRFAYTSPNSAPLNSEVTLYAITDTLRDNVRFTVTEDEKNTTITATNRELDGQTYIWSATHLFTKAGKFDVTASALYDGKWESCEFSTTQAFVTNSDDKTKCTLDERRVSDEFISLLGSFEGYSSTYYEDTLANNILTMGYGKVIYAGDVFYDNITKAEAKAYLINDTNNKAYTTDVNKLLRQNGIAYNQNQFDSLVCFSYNVGTGWTYDSGLLNVIKTKSRDKEEIEHKKGDIATVAVNDVLNLRSGPGTENSIIAKLQNGDKVTLLDGKLYNTNWYHVSTEDGKKGYCHKDYLIFEGVILGSLLNIKQDDIVPEMLKWHKASGNCVKGLVYRRVDELEMFLFAEYTHDGSRNKYGFALPSCC